MAGKPYSHRRAYRSMAEDFRRRRHPSHLAGWIERLDGRRATTVRAALLAAVHYGELDRDEAEWTYHILWDRAGGCWYCESLWEGRQDRSAGSDTALGDDPTIPRWWFDR